MEIDFNARTRRVLATMQIFRTSFSRISRRIPDSRAMRAVDRSAHRIDNKGLEESVSSRPEIDSGFMRPARRRPRAADAQVAASSRREKPGSPTAARLCCRECFTGGIPRLIKLARIPP